VLNCSHGGDEGMGEELNPTDNSQENKLVFDENTKILDHDKLPTHDALKVLRYKTIKKNNALGWWSAVVLLEDHDKKQICFYRWRKKKTDTQWKRDKKLVFHSRVDWNAIKDAVELFLGELE
jgi:hypothetical protein